MNPYTKSKVVKAILDNEFEESNHQFDAEIAKILEQHEVATTKTAIHHQRTTFFLGMYTYEQGQEHRHLPLASKAFPAVLDDLNNHIDNVKASSTRRKRFAAFMRKIANHSYTSGDLVALMPQKYTTIVTATIYEDNEIIENVSYTQEQIEEFKQENHAGYSLNREHALMDFIVGGI